MTSRNNFKREWTQSTVKSFGCLSTLCPKDTPFSSETNTIARSRKSNKFISITLNKNYHKPQLPFVKYRAQSPFARKLPPASLFAYESIFHTPSQTKELIGESDDKSQQKQEFEADKEDFFQQIRNFSPSTAYHESIDEQRHKVTPNNNLSRLMQNLNEQILDGMFVSSNIKSRIMESGTLDSITQVRSQLQKSFMSRSMRNAAYLGSDI